MAEGFGRTRHSGRPSRPVWMRWCRTSDELCRESLPAGRAAVGRLPAVDALVLRQVRRLAEGLATLRALVRPLPGVCAQVLEQAGALHEHLAARLCTRRLLSGEGGRARLQRSPSPAQPGGPRQAGPILALPGGPGTLEKAPRGPRVPRASAAPGPGALGWARGVEGSCPGRRPQRRGQPEAHAGVATARPQPELSPVDHGHSSGSLLPGREMPRRPRDLPALIGPSRVGGLGWRQREPSSRPLETGFSRNIIVLHQRSLQAQKWWHCHPGHGCVRGTPDSEDEGRDRGLTPSQGQSCPAPGPLCSSPTNSVLTA